MAKVHCVYGPKPAGLFQAGPATWASGRSQLKQGSQEQLTHGRWAATVFGDSGKPAPEMGGKWCRGRAVVWWTNLRGKGTRNSPNGALYDGGSLGRCEPAVEVRTSG
jgi:hypothetical protein